MADPCQLDIGIDNEEHMGMAAQTSEFPHLTAREIWADRDWENDVYMIPVEEDDPEDEVKPSGMPNPVKSISVCFL